MAPSYQEMLAEYLDFTRSPVRDRAERRKDFAELWRNPEVQALKFISTDTLVIGTTMMTARCYESGALHEIGEFLIFIVRYRTHRMWKCEFWFYNITHIVEGKHHPHIITEEKRKIAGHLVGRLCIIDGQHSVYQAIRTGNISEATMRLIRILKTYQTWPFLDISHWPKVEQGAVHE